MAAAAKVAFGGLTAFKPAPAAFGSIERASNRRRRPAAVG